MNHTNGLHEHELKRVSTIATAGQFIIGFAAFAMLMFGIGQCLHSAPAQDDAPWSGAALQQVGHEPAEVQSPFIPNYEFTFTGRGDAHGAGTAGLSWQRLLSIEIGGDGDFKDHEQMHGWLTVEGRTAGEWNGRALAADSLHSTGFYAGVSATLATGSAWEVFPRVGLVWMGGLDLWAGVAMSATEHQSFGHSLKPRFGLTVDSWQFVTGIIKDRGYPRMWSTRRFEPGYYFVAGTSAIADGVDDAGWNLGAYIGAHVVADDTTEFEVRVGGAWVNRMPVWMSGGAPAGQTGTFYASVTWRG